MKSCTVGGKAPDPDQIKKLKEITKKIPNDDTLIADAEKIKALSDPTRLKIIHLLEHGEMCVCEIITAMEKPQPTISHHLNILKRSGFLKWRKEGVWIHYKLSKPRIIEDLSKLINR
ncbi:MAG: metalloregulator ArsR/SmtB family transcription factor [Methanobacteriaceae archaeon]|nr:metalloregulator ArsR/SmtB family transcription factor [Methanobacteriaceae archaeon]